MAHELRVSWFHPHIIYDGQVCCCLAEPKLNEIFTDQAQRGCKLFDTHGYMMNHDEFRVLNQDEACLKTGKTPGQLLAGNARFCAKLLEGAKRLHLERHVRPVSQCGERSLLPRERALHRFLGRLDKSVIIMNWNFGKRDQSLKFFDGRGHRQIIAGYYDAKPERIKDWLASAAKGAGRDRRDVHHVAQ